jgi:hypothetical protein
MIKLYRDEIFSQIQNPLVDLVIPLQKISSSKIKAQAFKIKCTIEDAVENLLKEK